MPNRRRLTLLAFVLTLLLVPGLTLAQPLHAPAAEQSSLERLFSFAERAWSALTGQAHAADRHIIRKAGCGIDPNGCPLGGGAGTNGVTGSGGH